MTITALLPNELPDEITDLGANDYLVGQKSGETKLRKLKPSAISPADIGAANLAGSISQEFSVSWLNFPADGGGFRGPWVSEKGGYAWQLSSFYSSYYNTYSVNFYADNISFLNQNNSDRIPVTAKKFISDPAESTPNRNNVGFWFSDTAVGVSSNTYGQLEFMVDNTAQARVIYGEIVTKTVRPAEDNTFRLGKDGYTYIDVWAQDTTINTSDATLKTDVAESDLGLEFILGLRPVSYRWIVAEQLAIPPEEEGGEMTYAPRAGVRKHYGLLAQEVKAALGERDFAGWGVGETTQTQFLRYSEFIAPLIKALQELTTRVEALEAATGGTVAS